MTATSTSPRSAQPVEPGTADPADRTLDRVLSLTGIGFGALLLPVVLVPHASLDVDPTEPAPDPAAVVAFFEQHYALQQYQALAHSLAAVVLLGFFAALAAQVRRFAPQARLTAVLTIAGGAGITTIMLLTMALVAGSVSLTGAVDGDVQAWMYALGWWEHPKALYLLPVALVPACLVLRRQGVLPGFLAWPGIGLGVLAPAAMAAALSASSEFVMYPLYMLFLLWVLVVGVVAGTLGLSTRTVTDPTVTREASSAQPA